MEWDLALAVAHHLSVFALVAVFAAEFALVRPGLGGVRLRQLARLDLAYGALSAVVIVVGILRLIYGAAGWEYYLGNHAFWGKMIAFAIMGILTVPPTISYRRWSKSLAAQKDFAPPNHELKTARRYIHFQALVLAFIPIFAAMMARGYGA